MANTRNSGTRQGERQRRQQQPGSQQTGGRTGDEIRQSDAEEKSRINTQQDGARGQETRRSGQSTRSQGKPQTSSGWDDEESLRSNRRNEANDELRTRGETGEDEDLPSGGGRGGGSERSAPGNQSRDGHH